MSERRRGFGSTPAAWVDVSDERPVELAVIARQAGVRVTLVRRYLEFGLFEPSSSPSQRPLFEPNCASRLAKAERLRRDLGLNYAGAVLACELLDRIRELEDQGRSGPAGQLRGPRADSSTRTRDAAAGDTNQSGSVSRDA